MKFVMRLGAAAAVAMLGACSGGGSGGGGTIVTPTPTPSSAFAVTLTSSATAQTATDADSTASFTVQASYTGSAPTPSVPQFTFDSTLLTAVGNIATSGSTYTLNLKTKSGLAAQSYATDIGFRLCTDSTCATVHSGSSQKFTYSLDVKLADWATLQRNPAHNGYVHATFDPANFAKSWEYAGTPTTYRIYPVAAREGSVFATVLNPDDTQSVVALNGATGAERWNFNLGKRAHVGGPALAGGQLAIASMFLSSHGNPLVLLNADSGAFVRDLAFPSQWGEFAQPTYYKGNIFVAAGYYGNQAMSFDPAGAPAVPKWIGTGSAGRTWHGEAPAVDDNYVYFYSGNLDVFDRTTGALVKTITDPFWRSNGNSYEGTPTLGSANHVIAYSGNGQGTYNVAFPLVNYDIAGGKYRWRTADLYSNVPATAKGVIYAASNVTHRFDAIDEATGKVLWSWASPGDQDFYGNVVLTDTLAFVSTAAGVYAIALDGAHDVKWSAPTPGWLAITPDAKLVVTPRSDGSHIKMVAYSLR